MNFCHAALVKVSVKGDVVVLRIILKFYILPSLPKDYDCGNLSTIANVFDRDIGHFRTLQK